MNRAAGAVAVLAPLFATGAAADPAIDGDTKCQSVVGYLNARDTPRAREAFLAVQRLTATYDQAAIARGQPSALTPLSEEQAEDFYLAAIEYCRDDPQHTLGQAASDAYDGLRELHGQLPGRR